MKHPLHRAADFLLWVDELLPGLVKIQKEGNTPNLLIAIRDVLPDTYWDLIKPKWEAARLDKVEPCIQMLVHPSGGKFNPIYNPIAARNAPRVHPDDNRRDMITGFYIVVSVRTALYISNRGMYAKVDDIKKIAHELNTIGDQCVRVMELNGEVPE